MASEASPAASPPAPAPVRPHHVPNDLERLFPNATKYVKCPACTEEIASTGPAPTTYQYVNDEGETVVIVEPLTISYEGPHTGTVLNLIMHLNDKIGWTREQIADWLDALDLDLYAGDPIEARPATDRGLKFVSAAFVSKPLFLDVDTVLEAKPKSGKKLFNGASVTAGWYDEDDWKVKLKQPTVKEITDVYSAYISKSQSVLELAKLLAEACLPDGAPPVDTMKVSDITTIIETTVIKPGDMALFGYGQTVEEKVSESMVENKLKVDLLKYATAEFTIDKPNPELVALITGVSADLNYTKLKKGKKDAKHKHGS